MTKSDVLWKEIKNLPIEMFSLPNQKVESYVTRLVGSPEEVLLKLKNSATLPALESVLRSHKEFRKEKRYDRPHAEPETVEVQYPKYEMKENDGGYVSITRFVNPKDKKELKPLRGDYFVLGKDKTDSESDEEVRKAIKTSKDTKTSKPSKTASKVVSKDDKKQES